MLDIVRELALTEQVEQAWADACELARRYVATVERHVALARRCFEAGDDAAEHGDDERAEALWYAGAILAGDYDAELEDEAA